MHFKNMCNSMKKFLPHNYCWKQDEKFIYVHLDSGFFQYYIKMFKMLYI